MEFAFADPVIPGEAYMPLHTGLLVNLSLKDAKAKIIFLLLLLLLVRNLHSAMDIEENPLLKPLFDKNSQK